MWGQKFKFLKSVMSSAEIQQHHPPPDVVTPKWVRAFNFLHDVTVVHHCGGRTRMTLLAFFPALSILFGAYGGDAGGCCLAPASGHNCFHQSEGGSDGFLP
jgi:hypothetical protein